MSEYGIAEVCVEAHITRGGRAGTKWQAPGKSTSLMGKDLKLVHETVEWSLHKDLEKPMQKQTKCEYTAK